MALRIPGNFEKNRFKTVVDNHGLILSLFKFVKLCILVSFLISCQQEYNHKKAVSGEGKDKLFVLHEKSGIEFSNSLEPTTDLNILTYLYYYNGGGVAAGDLNNDGLVDLYFTGNQVADRLYLNQGALQFREVTSAAGIDNAEGWTTGVSFVDINNDGLLDIYVCKVGKYKGISGTNKLFVNKGSNSSGIPEFKEEAYVYNLNIKSFSTQAAFFDYDLDGDLDMYLLNHSVNPNRTFGSGRQREQIDTLAGDRLLRNDAGKFKDVSRESGIYQGKIGYGLGVGISDLNNDGYPDIYVGNDFFENDYLYMNLGNGTFRELISEDETRMGHTTHFSMGNDLADANNDGKMDILSVDMLPQDLEAYKTSGHEYNNQIYDQYLRKGFRPQYMQNTFHLNSGGMHFKEMAYASGLAATDWSWAPLWVDLDNDGLKDVFITNGIFGATNDMDFMNFIANDKIQSKINQGMEEKDLEFTKDLPRRKLPNYMFRNNGDQTFENTTEHWFNELPTFSNGAVYADLDNDGDLDLVVNNVNSKAQVLENRTDELSENKHITISFMGPNDNSFGIGAKIRLFADSLKLTQENFVSRGYLSSVPPLLNMGVGKREKVDSIEVIWPNGRKEVKRGLRSTQHIVFNYTDSKQSKSEAPESKSSGLSNTNKINWKHSELQSYEYGREPLIPYSKGYEGPDLSVADVNGDGLEDLYLCGGKKQAGVLLLQNKDGTWNQDGRSDFGAYSNSEETASHFFDADNDGDMDLIIGSGGNEVKNGESLYLRLYLNNMGVFTIDTRFPEIEINASDIVSADLDLDGDLDLVIASNAVPQKFAISSEQYVLFNKGNGKFEDVSDNYGKQFKHLGLIEDIEVADLNNDQYPDLIAAGHWAPISLLINDGKKLKLHNDNGLDQSHGLWNTIKATDLDNDGDLDLVGGNWGLNSRFKATSKEPLTVYIKDFDENGKKEAIVTFYHEGLETVFSSKDDLSAQLPSLNKKFLSYNSFAKAEVEDLFGKNNLEAALKKKVYVLEHSCFINDGKNNFVRKSLPYQAQSSTVKNIFLYDFDRNGMADLLLAGNDFNISTQLGRLDASHGEVLLNHNQGHFETSKEFQTLIKGKARAFSTVEIRGKKHLIISRNNDYPIIINLNDE